MLAVGIDGNASEFTSAVTDRLDTGRPFCTDGRSECGVLDVASGIDSAVGTFDRGTDRRAGLRYIGVHGSLTGHGHKFAICHGKHSFICDMLFQMTIVSAKPQRRPGLSRIKRTCSIPD